MRLVLLAWMLALLVSTFDVEAATPTSQGALPPPIATRQTLFAIPFQIDRAGQSSRDPAEIQLYVSTDRGANWQPCDRVRPEKGHFLFRAVTDGEYWFILRTLDRSGQLRPQRADGPGLRVIVDTTLPDLQLEAQRGEAGQIIVRWQVTDPHLELDSLKIQYRAAPDSLWQTVAIDRQRINTSGRTRTGEVIWWPEAGFKPVEIRAEVADTAGNSAVSHAKVNLDRRARADLKAEANPAPDGSSEPFSTLQPSPSGWRAATDFSPPTPPRDDLRNLNPAPYHPLATQKQPTESPGPLDAPNRRSAEKAGADSRSPDAPYREDPRPGVPRTDQTASADNAPDHGQDHGQDHGALQPPHGTAADEPASGQRRPSPRSEADLPTPGADNRSGWPLSGSIAADIHPPIRNRYVTPTDLSRDNFPFSEGDSPRFASRKPGQSPSGSFPSAKETAGSPGESDLPTAQRPQRINSAVFELEYQAGSGGPSGVGRVELWGTRDGGRTWTCFGVDDDHQSPMLASVDEEGVYGFRVVVQSGLAVQSDKPQSGDTPDVWVAVDLTEPEARILSAQLVTGDRAGELVIDWEAADQMLSARPVSLLFSHTSDGPWTTIASGLENTGRYRWPLDRTLPPRIYLRLEVRDEAGNVAVAQTTQAVTLDLLRPAVRIRNVRPVADTARWRTERYRSR